MRSSLVPFLSLAFVVLAVSAAPTANDSHDDKIHQIWSAITLWIYRLLHGGHYPPGYNNGGSSTSSISVSIPATSTAAYSSLISSALASASLSIFSSADSSSSISSTIPLSTSSASAATPTSTGLPSSGFVTLPSLDPTVCSAQDPSSFPLSCSVDSPNNTCCTTSPGGHLLLTQFWDTGSSSTGPNNSWTLHGLWPDNCDGTYEQYCDPSRELTNITQVLQQYQQDDLLAYMDTYWKDYQGDDETFWEHEYNKHGTCISSLEPRCFNNYTPQEETVFYFRRAVELFKGLDTYAFLAAAQIYPSLTTTYTLAEITAAVEKGFGGGGEANINCASGGVFDEVWYHLVSQGSVADGNLIPAKLVGSASSCPTTGIKYYPKFVPIPSSTTTSTAAAATSTGDGSSGYLYAVSEDGTIASGTCVISAGAWYKGGTCATFRITEVTGGSYTLTSSQGPCAVNSVTNLFSCASTIAAGSEFLIGSDGLLTLGGSTAFSTANVPAAGQKVNIYGSSSQTLPLTLKFVNK